jgi:hypothetical protein
MRTRLLIGIAIVAVVLGAMGPAAADLRPPDAYIDDDDNPTIEVGDDEDPKPGGGPVDTSCVWQVVISDDFVFHVYDSEGSATMHSATGRWLQRHCEGIGIVPVDGRFMVPEGGQVDLEGLAREALASVVVEEPVIHTSPEAGTLYVHVPTWLWVEGSWWRTYEATASAGRVTATISARPDAVTWTMGDGSEITCSNPGTPWKPGLAESATDCSYTYAQSSTGQPDGTFDLTGTVTLEVTWVANSGATGSLPSITRSTTRPVAVGEIQAIGTAR